jgi:arylsulfatase A-like enzyme
VPGWIAAAVLLLGCAEVPHEQRPNIVLVSLDTLRADKLGTYGGPAGLTPNLDRFASQALVFESAYAQSSETLFSHASLFTSRYPSELGTLDYDFVLPESEPTLAAVLGAYGYKTAAFTGAGHLHPDFGFSSGFEHYKADVEWGGLFHAVHGMAQYLDATPTEQPRFLFLHGYDAHPRYLKPPPFGFLFADLTRFGPARKAILSPMGTMRVVDGVYHPGAEPAALIAARGTGADGAQEALNAEDLALIVGAYDGAVAYADAWFGLLMAELDAREMLDDTLIVVLSDHGEELGENGVFNHRYSLSEPVIHVPLMIRLPGAERGGERVTKTAQLVDVLPTLLSFAGAEPLALARGQDLLGEREERPAFSEGPFGEISARDVVGTLTFKGIAPSSPYLAGLLRAAGLVGPAFSRSKGLSEGEAERLRDQMLDWRYTISPSPPSHSSLSVEQREKLREKGYWGPE